jgi:drug/metabolite transporter (DMT)-like permease
LLSLLLLGESASKRAWIGILLAILAIPLLSYQDAHSSIKGYLWLWYALLVFAAWGLQAFFMKKANNIMKAESIFFYMTLSGLLLIPVVLYMTDFSQNINWGFKGPYLTFGIQLLNSIGALTIVFAFRYGKAIIVSPVTNAAAPVITIILSLILYHFIPHPIIITGMLFAIISTLMLANES